MKNRLLLFLFVCSANLVQAQFQDMVVTMQGGSTCDCEGCFFVTISNANGPYTLQWSNGYTSTQTANTFQECGFCPGQYSVTVSPVNVNQSVTATGVIVNGPYIPLDIITLNPPPCNSDSVSTPPLSDCMRVCAGTTVTYTVANSVSGTSGFIDWNISGATSWVVEPPVNKTVTVTWGAAGTGSVSVFSDGSSLCFGEDFLCVDILEPPTAVIGSIPAVSAGNPLQICKGQTVDFQNLSTGDADYIEWLFSDDLSNTTTENPQHTFLNPGTHTVTLVAKSDCICSDTTTMTIEVLDAEAPTLDCVATVCPGATVTYTTSNACPPFAWNVSSNGVVLEGGTTSADSITIEWTDGPVGTVTLNAPACSGATCPVGGVISIPIISDNAEIRGKENVCPSAIEVYTIEPFGGSGFQWALSGGGFITEGQGTNRVSIQWNSNANPNVTFWLSVVYDNCYLGCGGRDSIPVKILPAFYLNGPLEVCLDASGTFTTKLVGSNLPVSCNWSLTGPAGSTVWTTSGGSTVNPPLTSGDGYYRIFATPVNQNATCTNQADWAVKAVPLPAKLTGIDGVPVICPGVPYTYQALGGTASSNYRWTVKNGPAATQIFSGKNVNVVWNATGPYWLSVAHVSNDGLNCQSDTVLLNISPLTIPAITGTPLVCEDDKGVYVIPGLENVDLQWQINPATAGSVSAGQGTNTAEIFWSQAGGHVVNLNVCGLTAVFPVSVSARPAPMVQAPTGLCPGATAQVQTATAFSTYLWKDGSGTVISTGPTAILGPGNYAVEVTDPNGCAGTTEFYIDSWDAPNISLTTPDPTGFCNNSENVHLSALVNTAGNYTFEWFQDGVVLPGITGTSYVTNQYGQYTVVATNAQGCTNAAGPITVFEYCIVGGSGNCNLCNGNPLCDPGTIQAVIDPTPRCDSFIAVLNDYSGLYVAGSAQWVAGISGGAIIGTSNDESPSFVFPNAGRYIIAVQVTLSNGDVCEALDSLKVEAVARFDQLPGCPGEATQFQDASELLPGLNIAGYAWSFGDPASGPANSSNLQNPGHPYAVSGDYQAALTVTGPSGCTSSTTQLVEVPELPNVAFPEPAANCVGNALAFIPPPNAADITEINWDFGDPSSGASNDASGAPAYHLFAAAGNYTVSATATNVYGCTATFSRSLNVVANALAGLITPPNPTICEGNSVTLAAPSGGNNVTYLWSDPAGTTTPFISVNEEGSFRVTLTDENGCTYAPPALRVEQNPAPDALIKALDFNDLNQIVGVSYPTTTVCDGEDVVLQAVSNGSNFGYNWSGSNGNNQLVYFTDDRNTLLIPGTYLYTVTVTNFSTGCTMVTPPFQVQVNPKPSGFSIFSNGYCAGNDITLNYLGPQPPNWQIFWNNGLSGPTMITDEPGSYFVRVINEFGCEARSNPQTVLPGPPVDALPVGCFTRCKPDTLCLPNLPTVTQWQWFFNGSPITGATTPDFVAQQSGVYWAELTDTYGCTAQSGPLTLNLYDGYGNILGQVWSDVNNNGMIDAADTLMSGIQVNLSQNGTPFNTAVSGTNGGFAFANVLSTNYLLEIDQPSLPPNWHIVIGQAPIALSGCDVQASAGLLLHFQCTAASSDLQLSACVGETATYNGVDIAAGNTQIFNFPGPGGCDSTVTVMVTTLATSSGTATLYACPGSTADYLGTPVPVGTTQNFTLQNALGCDSVVAVSVLPLQTSTGTATLFACPGSTADYLGTPVPVGTTQNFTLQNAVGCDSVVAVTVQAWSTSNTATLLFGCTGGTVSYNGTQIPVGTAQQFTFVNWLGCDSIVTVNTAALPPSTGTATLYACPGGTANYQGTDIAAGSSQSFPLQNWLGCDSIVTVSVVAWPTSSGTATLHACPGGAATYEGISLPVGATQNFTLQNWLGCDSIVAVNVQAWATSAGTATLHACPGSTATYQGVSLPVGATQNFTLQNWLGCDSIVTVNVQALTSSAAALEVGVCPGETYVYQGQTLSGGTVQQFTLQNWLGCDSLVTLTVKQLQASLNTEEVFVCPGEVYTINGVEVAGGQTREFHFSNAEGCDSTLTLVVNEFPAASFTVATQRSCANAGTGSLDIDLQPGGQGPFRFAIDGGNFQDDPLFEDLSAGDYAVQLEDGNGCLFEQPATIPAIPEIEVVLTNGILACDSTSVELRPVIQGGDAATLSIQWWNGAQTSATQATEAGTVWVEVRDQCGMERSEAQVAWADLSPDLQIVYVPNVFKPVSIDPENARFRPMFAAGINVVAMHFEVFDRWGNKLFETENMSDAWEGGFRADNMNPGVQVWHLQADISICGRILHITKKGDVTVVR